ncbi:hypothetical protein ACFC1R_05040 [Kitasatospora sp. NPDC056138]|uniref:hypothetical protein n=1 Tax=Kitasatospora sp. NPDC056138 TaxID=3345724 RepID=UPI0035DB040D
MTTEQGLASGADDEGCGLTGPEPNGVPGGLRDVGTRRKAQGGCGPIEHSAVAVLQRATEEAREVDLLSGRHRTRNYGGSG